MDKKAEILKLVPEQGVLPLFFNKDTDVSIEVLKALYNAGVRAIEYTNRGEAALVNFTAMVKVRDAELPGLYLGIGTIKNAAQAEAFVAAGADYLISFPCAKVYGYGWCGTGRRQPESLVCKWRSCSRYGQQTHYQKVAGR